MKMQVSLVQMFLQFSIASMLYLHAMALSSNPIFRTKKPRYEMRGEVRTPAPPEDYCRKGLCPVSVKHIICRGLFWGANCPKPREGVNMDILYLTIIDHHNNLRDSLSREKVGSLPKAKSLPRLQWDHELSIVAMRVTNYCNDDAVSECVNTARFLNVVRSSLSMPAATFRYDTREFVGFAIKSRWFGSKYTEVNAAFVRSFPSNASKEEVALANIINQRVRYVGCGMLIQGSGKGRMFHFTCLYNEEPKPGNKLYDIAVK